MSVTVSDTRPTVNSVDSVSCPAGVHAGDSDRFRRTAAKKLSRI